MRKRFPYGLVPFVAGLAIVLAGCGGTSAVQTGSAATPMSATPTPVATATPAPAATSTPPSIATATAAPTLTPQTGGALGTPPPGAYAVNLHYYNGGDYYIETSDVNVLSDVSKKAEGTGSQWRSFRALPTDPWAAKAQVVCAHTMTSVTPSGASVTAVAYVLSDGTQNSARFALAFCRSQGW